MPAAGAIRVEGLREVQRAFRDVSKDLAKQLRSDLSEIAEPVRARAEELAGQGIRNIGPRWSQMRIGVTQRTVYVAPKARRSVGSPRTNLGGLLMNRSMQPALDQQTDQVVEGVGKLLDRINSQF